MCIWAGSVYRPPFRGAGATMVDRSAVGSWSGRLAVVGRMPAQTADECPVIWAKLVEWPDRNGWTIFLDVERNRSYASMNRRWQRLREVTGKRTHMGYRAGLALLSGLNCFKPAGINQFKALSGLNQS